MKTVLAAIAGLCIIIVLLIGVCAWLSYNVIEDQRQIDQLCQATISLAQEAGAEDGNGFWADKEYCFFFADYRRHMALVGEFDGEIRYDKKPRLIIMHGISEERLNDWSGQPVRYGKFRKIR